MYIRYISHVANMVLLESCPVMELFFPVWDLYTWQEVVDVSLLLVVVAVVKVRICGGRRQMQQRWVSLWNWSTDIDGLPEVIILMVKSLWDCVCLKILEQILFALVFLTALVLRLFIRLCRARHWHIFMVYPLLPYPRCKSVVEAPDNTWWWSQCSFS